MFFTDIPVSISAQTSAENLALGKNNEDFELIMEGTGSDLDPAIKDVSIRKKEESILED